MVLLVEGDEDFPVGRRNLRAVAQGQVDAAVGDADVVQHRGDFVRRDLLAEELGDVGEVVLGLFQARAGGARTCSRIWPASTAGKKSCPTLGKRNSEPTTKTVKTAAVAQRWRSPAQEAAVEPAELFKLAVERLVATPDPVVLEDVADDRGEKEGEDDNPDPLHGRQSGPGREGAGDRSSQFGDFFLLIKFGITKNGQVDCLTHNRVKKDAESPAKLQPRDRGRLASSSQIDKISKQLKPTLLGPFSSASNGAPIIGPDLIVESGNACVIALHRYYRREGEANAYREYLVNEAKALKLKLTQVLEPGTGKAQT